MRFLSVIKCVSGEPECVGRSTSAVGGGKLIHWNDLLGFVADERGMAVLSGSSFNQVEFLQGG